MVEEVAHLAVLLLYPAAAALERLPATAQLMMPRSRVMATPTDMVLGMAALLMPASACSRMAVALFEAASAY